MQLGNWLKLGIPVLAVAILSMSILSISAEENPILPDWIRNIFIWYAEDQISESELISALQFLIDNGILTVGETPTSQTETSQNNNESVSMVKEQEGLETYGHQKNTFQVTVDDRGANEDCKKLNNCFIPSRIWIHPTDSIEFTNTGQVQHRLSSADRYLVPDHQQFYDQTIESGESFEYEFNRVGTYYVTCLNHPDMRIIIKVQ